MASIIQALKAGKILVSDGAWGTMLQQKGLKPGECPERWNLDHPEAVYEIAESYIRAGSDLVETNSFGGSSIKLEGYGLDKKAYDINKAAAMLSRKAAGQKKYVLGSIGPCGKMLMMEEVTVDRLYESFREQAMALEAGGADAIVVETMTDLQEALIAVKAARENTKLEVACTMTFDKTVNGEYRTMMGISPAEMTRAMLEAGVDIIGTNCGHGMKDMEGIVEEIRNTDAEIPILVHANAGIPEYRDGATVYPETPDDMAQLIRPVLRAGATIVGGCCGTTPEHISKIKEEVENKMNHGV
jgi:5-methyltetrahydrofolate--homocysteine methyltransferase